MATEVITGNGTYKLDTNFTAELFQAIATAHIEDNVLISPLLVEATLALLYLGSDGSTAEELKRTLQLTRFSGNAKMANYYAGNLETATKEPDTKIQLCSKILLGDNYNVAEEFQKIAQKYFHTSTEKITALENSTALQSYLNDALSKICANITENLLPSTVTAAILLIASNFKFKWFLPFSAYRSGIYDFHLNASTQQAVPMLFDDDMFVKFGEFRELDARAIELPCEHDDDVAMLLLLPNKRDGLSALAQQLLTVNLTELTDRMQMESVQVLLPKFSIDFECSLRHCLEKLNISSIFNKDANFKNLLQENSTQNLHITDILHKVRLDVNESGSEPSSVVAHKPIVISNSIESRQKFFRADHPFYFAIGNRDITYFVGHVSKF